MHILSLFSRHGLRFIIHVLLFALLAIISVFTFLWGLSKRPKP